MKETLGKLEIRRMRSEEREAVLDLLASAFDERALFARYMDFDPAYRPEDLLLALCDGQPVSCVQVFERRIRLGGGELLLGGIGSVGTRPDHRGRGLASELVRRQSERLRGRGASLGLLFSGRHSFYAPLGWVAVPLSQAALHAAPGESAPTARTRPVVPSDLPALRSLYEEYCGKLDGTTVRDDSYWRGQLRFAGSPDERITVAERDGTPVAYLRCVELGRGRCAMEFARRNDAADALAVLLCEAAPRRAPLFLRLPPDPALEAALAERGARIDPLPDRSAMWQVLDRAAISALVPELPVASDDEAFVHALVRGRRLHYWLADRF